MMAKKKEYNKEELIKTMKEAFNKNPNLVEQDFVIRNNLPPYQAYINCFGSFQKAKEICGLLIIKIISVENKTKDDLKNELISIKNKLGKTPTYTEFIKNSDYNKYSIKKNNRYI